MIYCLVCKQSSSLLAHSLSPVSKLFGEIPSYRVGPESLPFPGGRRAGEETATASEAPGTQRRLAPATGQRLRARTRRTRCHPRPDTCEDGGGFRVRKSIPSKAVKESPAAEERVSNWIARQVPGGRQGVRAIVGSWGLVCPLPEGEG